MHCVRSLRMKNFCLFTFWDMWKPELRQCLGSTWTSPSNEFWLLIARMRLNSLHHIFTRLIFRDLKSLNNQLLREFWHRRSLLSRTRIDFTKRFGDLLRMIERISQWFNLFDSNLFRNRLRHDSFRMVPILLVWLIHQFGWVVVVDLLKGFRMVNRIVDFCVKENILSEWEITWWGDCIFDVEMWRQYSWSGIDYSDLEQHLSLGEKFVVEGEMIVEISVNFRSFHSENTIGLYGQEQNF
jgi:hypothetical protein